MLPGWTLDLLMTAGDAPAPPPPAGEAAPSPGGGLFQMLVPFLLMFLIFYFLIIRPESRKRKEREARIGGVRKGDIVTTTGGIIGKVWKTNGNEVVLVIDKDKDVKVTFSKNAIFDLHREADAAPPPAKTPQEEAKP
jgi:preprotein translocase subunit YajC